jgi:hypothetical protein
MGKKLSANELQQQNDRLLEGKEKPLNSLLEIEELEKKRLISSTENHTSINWAIGALKAKDQLDSRTIQLMIQETKEVYGNYGGFIQMIGLDRYSNPNQIRDTLLDEVRKVIDDYSGFDERMVEDTIQTIKYNLHTFCHENNISAFYPRIIHSLAESLRQISQSHQHRYYNCPGNEDPNRHYRLSESYLHASNIVSE